MIRRLRMLEVLAYLVAGTYLVACLNSTNSLRHVIAAGADGRAAELGWDASRWGLVAAVALAVGLVSRFAVRIAAVRSSA